MRVRKLSGTGDSTFGSGLLNYWINTPEAVAQTVQTSLLLWYGEWYVDTTLGMPWIQGVLGKHSQSTADLTVQDYVLNIIGVTNIENYQSTDLTARRIYSASLLLNTVYGPTPTTISNQALF